MCVAFTWVPAFFFTIGSVELKFRPNSSLTSITNALISVESAIPIRCFMRRGLAPNR